MAIGQSGLTHTSIVLTNTEPQSQSKRDIESEPAPSHRVRVAIVREKARNT